MRDILDSRGLAGMTGSAENRRGYAERGGLVWMYVYGTFWPSSRSAVAPAERGGMEFVELKEEADVVRRTGRFMKSAD